MAIITNRKLNSAHPTVSSYFIKDDKVKGFTVKVNSLGSIKFMAEVCQGKLKEQKKQQTLLQ